MKLSNFRRRSHNRASRGHEERVAEEIHGRVQAGSGCSPRARGDCRARNVILTQNKSTSGKGTRVTLDDLKLLEKQAGAQEIPIFHLEFRRMGKNHEYAIIPWWHLKILLEEAGVYFEQEQEPETVQEP